MIGQSRLPALPSTSLLGNKAQDVSDRCEMLRKYMQALVETGALEGQSEFRRFLNVRRVGRSVVEGADSRRAN